MTSAQLLNAGLSGDIFDDQPDDSANWLFLQYDSSDIPSDVSPDWVFLQQHGLNNRGDYRDVEHKKSDGGIPTSWVLLDNQSTIDVFMNCHLLQNIQTITATMQIHCNAGISMLIRLVTYPATGQHGSIHLASPTSFPCHMSSLSTV